MSYGNAQIQKDLGTQREQATRALEQLSSLKLIVMQFTDREAALSTIKDLQNAEMKIIASMFDEPVNTGGNNKR